jgi:hypothetical protein
MLDPGEIEDLPFEFGVAVRPLRPRTRDELVQLLVQVQFAADRLGTAARRALILVHGLAADDDGEEAGASVIPWR